MEQDNNELFDRIIELEDELYGEEDNGIEDQEETEEGDAQVTYRIIGGD